ncbi:uncharacterized protein LOC117110814 isoform X2 [Anneissia japonica]|uniref:uncharacterized protein LOC117110814 isoform X2 n=1 Tax=Anneissia japonica TaxID=1529436 RepID=UPI0014257073|nr:uncharacterized protein LOC117110814 isoform X2 [Anneissia japonica]
MQRSCNSAVVALLLLFCNKLDAQGSCCYRSNDSVAIDSINIKATFLTIDLYNTKWDLQVNISWTPVEGYNRYIVELETYSAPSSSNAFCNPLTSCTFDGVSERNWKVFTGIQFGSIQRVRVK